MTLAIEKPRRLFWLMGAFLPAFLTANHAEAVTLRLRPPSQIINVGSTAVVGVEISGLGDFQSPSLSGFGLEVTFNPSIVSFQNLTFGYPVLGDLLAPTSFQTVTTPTTVLVSFSEISAADAATLNALQPSSFILGSLNFTGTSAGISPLTLSVSPDGLLDENLDFLTVTDIQQANITVNDNPNTTTPEPTTNFLTFLVLFLFGIYQKKKTSNLKP